MARYAPTGFVVGLNPIQECLVALIQLIIKHGWYWKPIRVGAHRHNSRCYGGFPIKNNNPALCYSSTPGTDRQLQVEFNDSSIRLLSPATQ